ncbi:hypothetical protein NL676_019660 [Syzygium grande]|nr:hypothetical protein NL676_019660 [Syzygium grande]
MQHRDPEGLIHGVQDSMVLKEKSHLVLEAKTHEKKSHNMLDADLRRSAKADTSFKPSINGARGGDGRGGAAAGAGGERVCLPTQRERE